MDAVCSVVVPTFNRRDTVVRCLDHLAGQTVGPDRLQVVVVDDGSVDDTVQTLRSRFWPFGELVVHAQANAGPAAARNRGLASVSGPLTLFINDDALLSPDAVAHHVETHRRHSLSMVLGSFDLVPDAAATPVGRVLAQTTHLFSHPLLDDGDIAVADLAATCNLSVPTVAAVEAGFDERFTFAAEDVDFALRLQDRGYTLRYAARAAARHDHRLTVDGIERMMRQRGLGAARLAMKRGVPDNMLSDVQVVMTDVAGAQRSFAAAGRMLRDELDAGADDLCFSDSCYAALDTVARLGNLLGYLDEPALVRRARESATS